MGLRCVAAFLLLVCFGSGTALNNRPIIGVLDQPSLSRGNVTIIAASYIKFLESAGARVVPIRYASLDKDGIVSLFNSINGLLFPGGGVDLSKLDSTYMQTSKLLWSLAIAANVAGDHFPLYGTCMGFQQLAVLATGDPSVLCGHCFNSEGIDLPLELTDIAKSSQLFRDAPDNIMHILATENVTENSHVDGILPSKFARGSPLEKFFRVLSYNHDLNGTRFISTMEAKNYPIFASQWHPEKNTFEWTDKINIPHSPDATRVTQYMADFFVDQTRLSNHSFPTEEAEKAALIYNWDPIPDPDGYFEQIYAWPLKQ